MSTDGHLSKSRHCPRCGNTMGVITRCTNCNSVGCGKCIRNPGSRSTCPVCGRLTKIVAV